MTSWKDDPELRAILAALQETVQNVAAQQGETDRTAIEHGVTVERLDRTVHGPPVHDALVHRVSVNETRHQAAYLGPGEESWKSGMAKAGFDVADRWSKSQQRWFLVLIAVLLILFVLALNVDISVSFGGDANTVEEYVAPPESDYPAAQDQ